MATISRVKTWIAGDTLTAADLNAEFDNIVNDYDGNITAVNVNSSTGSGNTFVFQTSPSLTTPTITSPTLAGTLAGTLRYPVTTVNAATYDLLTTDMIVHVTYTGTGAVTSLTLPTAQTVSGRAIEIIDAGGNAATNNITIDTEGSETINGSATLVINTDYGAYGLYSDGSNWFIRP